MMDDMEKVLLGAQIVVENRGIRTNMHTKRLNTYSVTKVAVGYLYDKMQVQADGITCKFGPLSLKKPS